ncbi:MAG: terminase large subunit, partial [Muribaculaceae bacterium]|nr:terminase large subunit [Muribaculaceae bacterium]
LFVPRKFSKTTSVAALAVYDLLFGDNNSQAFVGANSYDQAKICFEEIRAIMHDLDPGERHFKVNREKITFKDAGRDGFIRCLTANARTQDGLNASLVIMDEYAQARDSAGKNGSDLKNTLTSSMGIRREPLTIVISTASEVIDGPFVRELDGVKAVLRGEVDNDTVFASLFMPDADDADGSPETWAKVQPHLGVTVRENFYQEQWAAAQLSADNMMNFRTKLLNIFTVNERRTWFTWEQANSLLGSFDIDRVKGSQRISVAFDLSVKDDFSAVSYMLYSSDEQKFYCHTDYYFPAGQLSGHHNEQLYRKWIADGHLKLCKGNCIDVSQIANDILKRSERMIIRKIGYDNYKARDLVTILMSAGAKDVMEPYSQRYGNFNLPVESMEMMV